MVEYNNDSNTYRMPTSGIRQSDSNKSNKEKFKLFCKRHLHAIVAILAIVLALVILFIVDRNLRTIHLTLSTNGSNITYQTDKQGEPIKTDTLVRILSFNADIGVPNDLLYYIDTTATADPDHQTLSLNWQVPDEARYRSTYTEFCLLDSDPLDKNVNNYCQGVDPNATHQVTTDSLPNAYNKVSCTYYISAHSVGLLATVSGWNHLNETQLVGCAGTAKQNNTHWGNESLLKASYGIYGLSSSSSGLVPNTGVSGLTMQNFFQSLIDGRGGDINAADVIRNSFSTNFTYNENTQKIDLSTTGVLAGSSCATTYTTTYSRPAPVNGSDNTTTQTNTCLPVFSVDRYGRITKVSTRWISYDATTGNEVVGVYGMHSGLTRYGAGTYLDPYTLAINIGDGLIIDDSNNITILFGNEDVCSAGNNNPQLWFWDKNWTSLPVQTNINTNPVTGNLGANRLAWTGSGFQCVHDTDNQQLALDSNSYITSTITKDPTYQVGGDTDTHSSVTKYTIGLTGDNSSFIQFVDRDTFYTQEGDANNNPTNGLTINNSNHTIAINAPYCADYQKTVWKKDLSDTNSHFECIYTTDRIIRGTETGYINDLNNGLTIVDNNDGTTTISITNTGAIVGHYGNSFLGSITTDSNGIARPTSTTIAATDSGLTSATTFKLPVLTINSQGQVVAIQDQTITKARLADTTTSGLTLVGDGSVDTPYQLSVNLTTDGGLVKGGTGQLGTTDQLEFKSCPAGYVLASKGLGQGYDCSHIDALESINQSYHAGTSLSQVIDWQPCTIEVFGSGRCYDPESGVWNGIVWTYISCAAYDSPGNCAFQAGGTFNLKYDATKGLTIIADGSDTGKLATKLGDGLIFDANGQIALKLATDRGLSLNANGLKINSPDCATGLSWDTDNGFGCAAIYSWTLGANSQTVTTGVSIGGGTVVNFNVGSVSNVPQGLSVSRSGNAIAYSVKLKSNGGLTFDSNGNVGLPDCAVGQILKWRSTSPNWYCATDNDTTPNCSGEFLRWDNSVKVFECANFSTVSVPVMSQIKIPADIEIPPGRTLSISLGRYAYTVPALYSFYYGGGTYDVSTGQYGIANELGGSVGAVLVTNTGTSTIYTGGPGSRGNSVLWAVSIIDKGGYTNTGTYCNDQSGTNYTCNLSLIK